MDEFRGISVPKAKENSIRALNSAPLIKKYLDGKIIPEGRKAFVSLIRGNLRHVGGNTRHNSDRKRNVARKFVEEGQKPLATALACSDSRVKLSRIFDKKDGRIFDVKIAGNIAYDRGVLGSLEYGVAHLHTPLLIVMGHEGCGAVAATCAGKGSCDEGHISFIVEGISNSAAKVGYDYESAILINIFDSIEQIRRGSNIIYALEKGKKVSIVAAYYSMSTGEVAILDRE